nr:DUF4145 domain-containing protein [Fredinandcohnia onubensis]
MGKNIPPVYGNESFHCPFCNVLAHQHWYKCFYARPGMAHQLHGDLEISICGHCREKTLWFNEKMLYPDKTIAPPPHDDLPEDLLDDYTEASSILTKSPRGAAALLRLTLQKLMVVLGEQGKDINKDIGSLVSKGLHPQVQQALDIVRVIGNESVHPGQLDLKDDFETALQLFDLVNFIVEDRISRPRAIADLFNKLPEGKRKGIEIRDKAKTP